MVRRIAIAIVAAAVLGLVGFFFLAWRPAIAPIVPPIQASFAPTPFAPAIANAIFAAMGERVRHLPIRAEAVREALAHRT
jgi:hypothetical protein